jgi:hypothetical protein
MHVPVYRSFSSFLGDHLYSLTAGEGSGAGYSNEGVVFYVTPQPCAAGLVPLNRLSHPGVHYLSASAAEIANLTSVGWSNEGVLGCVSPADIAGCGTSALHKMYDQGYFFFTSNPGDLGALEPYGWADLGVIAYVWNSP